MQRLHRHSRRQKVCFVNVSPDLAQDLYTRELGVDEAHLDEKTECVSAILSDGHAGIAHGNEIKTKC